jgi:hypothetical protein
MATHGINNPNSLLSKAHLTNLNLNHFKMVEDMGITNYYIEVPLNGIICPPNFMKLYQAVQKLVGETQTDR